MSDKIVCPYCEHVMTDGEMYNDPTDLYAIAPDEGQADVECQACSAYFVVEGGYIPVYETRKPESDDD